MKAMELIRTLNEAVVLVPDNNKLRVASRVWGSACGNSGAFRQREKAQSGRLGVLPEQITVVAGVGFETTTFRL